ncbi:hypothetical protein M404DRAFT_130349 [Pisolithus tinctorius Marx 270]|uniref:Uncharacterized protein n=1 Tax=Pisolithus tinctorius Marx 270 TaxID=870435 RepID=A0A0C3K4A2_PISTI|nr:hypothetical protein M404DRAFT_143429 [Pisolithus tinctorius Marx 270]KIO09803.1 hypothetical protein M404DRAFT_130349 [Pisolithus tinctorius Marx 270]
MNTTQPPASQIIRPDVVSSVPALSPLLIAHATKSLPTSSLFLEAARSSDALDESDLPRWEEDPPYMDSEPDSTLQEERFTQNLIDVMLGRRMRLSNESKVQRERRFAEGDHKLIFAELVDDLKEQIARWSAAIDIVGSRVSGGRNNRMAACWLQWRAREIYDFAREALVLENGGNPYHNNST